MRGDTVGGAIDAIRHRVIGERVPANWMRLELAQRRRESRPARRPMQASHADPVSGEDELALAAAGAETLARHGIGGGVKAESAARKPNDPTTWGKVGRNEA